MVRRSALKAVAAGLAGAVLTNPLDVLRNECFKREQPVGQALKGLYRDEGLAFMHRSVSGQARGLWVCFWGRGGGRSVNVHTVWGECILLTYTHQ
jgi:hypothetical protein